MKNTKDNISNINIYNNIYNIYNNILDRFPNVLPKDEISMFELGRRIGQQDVINYLTATITKIEEKNKGK